MLRILRKGRSGVLTSTDFETMASHDVGAVYFTVTEYLSVLFQLTYLDKLYGECNGTARACVNSGYQALFSSITKSAWERGYTSLGTRLFAHSGIVWKTAHTRVVLTPRICKPQRFHKRHVNSKVLSKLHASSILNAL